MEVESLRAKHYRILLRLRDDSASSHLVDLLLAAWPNAEDVPRKSIDNGAPLLTARELDVLELMAERRTSKEIASTLTISVHTARNHRKHILDKLDSHNRAQAIARARAVGLLPLA